MKVPFRLARGLTVALAILVAHFVIGKLFNSLRLPMPDLGPVFATLLGDPEAEAEKPAEPEKPAETEKTGGSEKPAESERAARDATPGDPASPSGPPPVQIVNDVPQRQRPR